MLTTDFLVIGLGIVGISIARELKSRFPDAGVLVVEKEPESALHSSGRNSGVLHAGFYYTADSLKARFTRDGNRQLTEYCDEYSLPINKCGKLVVAKDESELGSLDELFSRGHANGIEIQQVTANEARDLDPRAITFERALYSPTTSSVDPLVIVRHMEELAKSEKILFLYNTSYLSRKGDTVTTTGEKIRAGYVVNAAGLHADKIALDYGYSKDYRILPFKGLYLYSSEPPGSFNKHIYPVPDLRNPFLGVHFTITVEGKVKIGPTAIPAFWRENYQGLNNFSITEMIDIVSREFMLLAFGKFDFLQLTLRELRKFSRKHMVHLATHLATGIKTTDYKNWGKPGIRAQLVNIRTKQLEMDFVIEGDNKSMHILNAVSPGFTCSIPFARHVCDSISENLN